MANRNNERILYCTVTQRPGQGGIARVSSLLWRILESRYSSSCDRLVAAGPGRDSPNLIDKTRFSAQVVASQVRGACSALLFDHLGLSRAQTLVPESLRRPYGIFLHSIEAWAPLTPNRLKALVEARVRIANSHYTAKRIAAAHPEVGEIDVCPLTLGLNLQPNPGHARHPEGKGAEVLSRIRPESALIVGRLAKGDRYKGHDQLIQSWPLVLREVPGAQLVIVGSGDDLDRLKTLVADLDLGSNVLFTGFVEEQVLTAIYEKAAVFAMPSRAEGFGIVYLEAMFHGLPCIGSIHDAAGEVILDGETGLLVDQGDLADIASKTIALLKQPELRRRFGQKGFQRLQSQFSFDQFQAAFLRSLAKLNAA